MIHALPLTPLRFQGYYQPTIDGQPVSKTNYYANTALFESEFERAYHQQVMSTLPIPENEVMPLTYITNRDRFEVLTGKDSLQFDKTFFESVLTWFCDTSIIQLVGSYRKALETGRDTVPTRLFKERSVVVPWLLEQTQLRSKETDYAQSQQLAHDSELGFESPVKIPLDSPNFPYPSLQDPIVN